MSRSASALHYYNRETAKLETEVVYGEPELLFLYGTPVGGLLRKLFVTRRWFSGLNSIPKRWPLSKRNIPRFVERYEPNIAEAEKSVSQYRSLDEFFARRLKSDARPICSSPSALVSPADGRAIVYEIDATATLLVKGQHVSVEALLQSQAEASSLSGGHALVIRLAPRDYHRFHFPCDGHARLHRSLPGRLESVHPIALKSGAKSFYNKRDINLIESPVFGNIYIVEVGALTIGTIVQSFRPGVVRRGQEKGFFRFGGSTVILLWGEYGPIVDNDIESNSRSGVETLIKFGTQIASARQ